MRNSIYAALVGALMLAACTAAAHQQRTEPAGEPATPAPAPIVAAHTQPTPPVEPIEHRRASAPSCDLSAQRTANGVLIEARVSADRDMSGEYNLVITKSGGRNSSDISQSGPLTMAAGTSAVVGQNEINIEPGARVRALLTLHGARGEICRRSLRL